MDAPITPEHLQLLSDKKLEEVAEEAFAEEASADMRAALVRMARYEIRRRSGDVPVRDRYRQSGGSRSLAEPTP